MENRDFSKMDLARCVYEKMAPSDEPRWRLCLCDLSSGSLWAPLGIVWLSLGKLWEALGSQDGARMAPDGAKMVQDEAKMAQDGARMAQDVGQTSPEESRQQNKNKSIHPNSRSSSFAG